MRLRSISSWLAALLLIATPAQVVTAQVAPASAKPVKEMSAAPGKSGGEGGGFATNVTLKAATLEEPFLQTIVGQPGPTPDGATPQGRCLLLAYHDFSTIKDAPTQLTGASVRAANDGTTEICQVDGFIAPQVGFRMILPTTSWNGKFMQVGCGGRCGTYLPDACEEQVKRGYACMANDLGHKSTTYDNLWAIDNVPGEIDFGFRATHVAALTGKAITEAYYSQKPKYSYFIGASTGGRQALVAVQKFPDDYDGVVGGEPAMTVPGVSRDEGRIRMGVSLIVDGKPLITPDDVKMLNRVTVAACDADDGLKDGIITDPRTCNFKTQTLLCRGEKTPDCLTQVQIDAVNSIYRDGKGQQKGSELAWLGAYIAKDGSAGRYSTRRTANPYSYPYTFVFDDATNPDIRPFEAAGGKFILYTGWADEVINPNGPVRYYEGVERLVGSRKETQAFFRFFAIPGQSHIPGNVGAESIDYVKTIENWVEHGQAPDVLIGRKLKWITQMMGPMVLAKDNVPSNYLYSRPQYPYPIQARYKGKGDPTLAESFGPWDPKTGKWVR